MGALGVSERIIDISIISYGKNSLDLRPTWVTTGPRERIEFVSHGPTVYVNLKNLDRPRYVEGNSKAVLTCFS
jgi:hypothetical protein